MISGPTKPGLYAKLNTGDPLGRGLAGLWLFNEKGGLTVRDLSPNGNAGTLTNTPTWGPGKFGSGINFASASSQYISIADFADYDFPNTTFSVSFWFKTSTTALQYILGKTGPASNNGGWGVGIAVGGTTGKMGIVTKNTGATTNCIFRETSSTVTDGRWHHCVVIFTTDSVTSANNTATIYIDGRTDQGSLTLSGVSDGTAGGSQPLLIGGRGTATSYLNGSLDNVRIYNRRLFITEILKLYHDPFVGIIDSPDRIRKAFATVSSGYTLTGTSASVVYTSNNGTLTYTPTGTPNYTLTGTSGSITYTQNNGSLTAGRYVDGATGSVSYTGNLGTLTYTQTGACLTVADIPAIVSAVMQYEIETGVSLEAALRIILSVLAGKVSGGGTGVETFRDINDIKDRVVSTVDSSGNRISVITNGT